MTLDLIASTTELETSTESKTSNLVGQIETLQSQVKSLETEVSDLESRILDTTNNGVEFSVGGGYTSLIAAVFCALWAQHTRRNVWRWFILGLLFAPITLLVLLFKNSEYLRSQNSLS